MAPILEIPGKVDPKLADIAEVAHPRRPRDTSFYAVLILAVIPIWSIVPLSWVFVLYALRTGKIWSYTWIGQALFALALVEVFFSVYHYHLARAVSTPVVTDNRNLTELQAAFRRVLKCGLADLPEHGYDEEDVGRPGSPEEDLITLERHDPRAVDFRNCIRTWFGKAPWSSIHREEMFAWLHWAIFNTRFHSFEALPPARQQVLREALDMIEKRAGAAIPHGSNPDVRAFQLTSDPVFIAWRPFIWYLGVALSNQYHRRQFKSRWNVTVATFQDLDYVLYTPSGWKNDEGPRPVVFLHGLGLGLTQYKMFLSHLFRLVNDRPILVPLQPHVSQEIFHPRYLRPMDRHECADALAGLIEHLGWARRRHEDAPSSPEPDASAGVTVLSHSNGSYVHSWFLKAHPEIATRSCFVDPVAFCGWEGDLCYNFIYRPCSNGLELVMKYFVGAELGVANFLQRHFDWNANTLWYEQIPNARDHSKTMFLLGGKDAIVDAARVKQYLTSHGIRKGLWFDPDGRHGEALLAGGAGHTEILRWIREGDSSNKS